MTRPHRPTAEFPAHLDALYRGFPVERSLAQDPLGVLRPYARDRASAEVHGLFASTLAIGTTTSIRNSFGVLVERSGGDLLRFVDGMDPSGWRSALAPFQHRWIRADQLGYLGRRLKAIRLELGSVEEVFAGGFEDGGYAHGLDALSRELRGRRGARVPDPAKAPPGYVVLFPSPLDPGRSPCKRLALFVRWMTRTSYPDLGVWTRVPESELRVPLDHHVFWIAYHLGLTPRRTPSWSAVEEVTAALRAVDPVDPVKYDFVLCHTGVSGDCPKRRDLTVCGPCAVRPDCLLWRGRAAA